MSGKEPSSRPGGPAGAGRLAGLPADLLVTALLVALYAAARLWRLAGACLWFDEVFGVHAAGHSWGGLWSFVAADLIHPPLFYALLKLWVAAGGESILWLELFSYVVSLAALVPFLLLARELRLGAAATNVALLLFAAGGYFIKYAQEVRMYALLLLLALTSLWLFARLVKATRPTKGLLLALFAVNLLLVYTHYYGWLVVCGEGLYLALRRGRRKLCAFLATAGLVVVCFAPWVLACARAAGAGRGLAENVGWIERPTFADALGFYGLLHEPFSFRQSSADPVAARGGLLLGALLVGLPAALLFLRSLRGAPSRGAKGEDGRAGGGEELPGGEYRTAGAARRRARGLAGEADAVNFLAFFSLFPVAASFVASHALPHAVWGPRHLIVAAGPYLLLAGAGVARLRPAWLRAAVLGGLGCWLLTAGVFLLARPEPRFVWCAWGELANRSFRAEAKAAGATDVFAFEDLVAYQLWHALRDEGGRFRVSVVGGVPGLVEDRSFFLPRAFDEVARADAAALGGERFWLAFRDTEFDETRPPLSLVKGRGYRVARTYETRAQGQRVFLVLVSRERAGAAGR